MNTDNRKVSIIVPVYNTEMFLSKCINSVLEQSYSDFELILVDDGSTDNSSHICDEYVKTDNRIKVIHKKNGGAGDARNFGLNIATGEYISFLDSDDYWDKDFLFNAIQKVQDADIYISGIKMYGDGAEQEYASKIEGFFSIREMYEKIFSDIPQICVSGPCCKLFKRSIISDNDLKFDIGMRCGEDTDFILNYIRKAKIAYIDKSIFYNYYRGNSKSLFSSYNPQYYQDHVKVFDNWLKLIISLGCTKKVIADFESIYIRTLIANIYSTFYHNCEKAEKKRIIKQLSQDKMINSKIKLNDKKANIIKCLLKNKMIFTVYILFQIFYGKCRHV